VIAGDIGDLHALAGLPQKLLDNVVVGLRPVPGSAQPPAVDDVADQVDGLGLMMAQEIDQELGLGRLRPEMDVGDEERSEAAGFVAGHRISDRLSLPGYAAIHATGV
jgi:hypothetical protein